MGSSFAHQRRSGWYRRALRLNCTVRFEYILAATAWTNSHAVASVLRYLSSQALPR